MADLKFRFFFSSQKSFSYVAEILTLPTFQFHLKLLYLAKTDCGIYYLSGLNQSGSELLSLPF
jgi:hypothetical protein